MSALPLRSFALTRRRRPLRRGGTCSMHWPRRRTHTCSPSSTSSAFRSWTRRRRSLWRVGVMCPQVRARVFDDVEERGAHAALLETKFIVALAKHVIAKDNIHALLRSMVQVSAHDHAFAFDAPRRLARQAWPSNWLCSTRHTTATPPSPCSCARTSPVCFAAHARVVVELRCRRARSGPCAAGRVQRLGRLSGAGALTCMTLRISLRQANETPILRLYIAKDPTP